RSSKPRSARMAAIRAPRSSRRSADASRRRRRESPSVQFLDLTVQGWLEELGEPGPAPGGGSAAAIAAAMGAELVAMAARISADSWPEAGGSAAEASTLSIRMAGLAEAGEGV